MKKTIIKWSCAVLAVTMSAWVPASDLSKAKIEEIAKANDLNTEKAAALEKALKAAPFASQGNAAAIHPMTREQCQKQGLNSGVLKGGGEDVKECGHPNMAVVPTQNGGKVCIDRYEFPNVACDYPITWTQADQAENICRSIGKRLCDAHEWEGACSNTAQPDDWKNTGNGARKKVWAYGDKRDASLCAFGQPKSPGCDKAIETDKSVRESCGANTWPAGSFPKCAGELGVYDLHGNAAEHMNLARSEKEAGRNKGSGVTEMKGSWFVFPKTGEHVVHEDDCLWRAPGWHRTDIANTRSHANYHLGFRCCADAE